MNKRKRHKPVERPKGLVIAPRLANGDRRVGFAHGLPDEIKEGLRAICYSYSPPRSMAWVMETLICEFFHMRRPKYVKPKPRKQLNNPKNNVVKFKKSRTA